MKEFIDASLFLGMHSSDEKTRIACKNFFVKRLKQGKSVTMSLEQVGKCDDVIWSYSREEQDSYYPFMDMLHTDMDVKRIPYHEKDIETATTNSALKNLSLPDRLAIGMTLVQQGVLYTVNPQLLSHKDLPCRLPAKGKELSFPKALEELYKESLELKIAYKGVIPPLVTPVDKNGKVCEQSIENLTNILGPYSSAWMPALSSGEGWALDKKQWEDMVRLTIKHSYGLPVLAGIELRTTNEVIKRAKIAKKMGVNAVVVTTPFEKDISQEDIFEHFRRLNKEVDIPIFIYNEETISGNAIGYNTMLKICELGNIVGIKEASGSAGYTRKLLNAGLSIPIFQGWEHLCHKTKGVDGYILPLSNLEPEVCADMLNQATQEKQSRIDLLCKRYNISGKDWYAWLKKELKKRRILTTEKVV
jgi:4-hydroxy-tetrahydrodipicolinate synthase